MPVYAPNYISNFRCQTDETNPTHKVSISDGYCKDSTNTYPLVHPDTKYADIETSGAGGLDAGVEAADTWYYIFVIYSLSTNQRSTLLSTSPTDPTLPSGYDLFRRVGDVRNNTNSDFIVFYQHGNSNHRHIHYWATLNELAVLLNGNAVLWTQVDCTSLLPATSDDACIYSRQTANRDAQIRPLTFPGASYMLDLPAKQSIWGHILMPSRILEYLTEAPGGTLDIHVLGYEEDL